jgi:hypothetical protein
MKWQKGKPKTGGRVPGVPNRATQDIKAIAQGLIEDPAYQANLKARLLKGTSPTLEVLLHYYAYGKPKTEIVTDKQVHVHVHRGEMGPPIPLNPPVQALPGLPERLTEEP